MVQVIQVTVSDSFVKGQHKQSDVQLARALHITDEDVQMLVQYQAVDTKVCKPASAVAG